MSTPFKMKMKSYGKGKNPIKFFGAMAAVRNITNRGGNPNKPNNPQNPTNIARGATFGAFNLP
jgi:hypothetical protein